MASCSEGSYSARFCSFGQAYLEKTKEKVVDLDKLFYDVVAILDDIQEKDPDAVVVLITPMFSHGAKIGRMGINGKYTMEIIYRGLSQCVSGLMGKKRQRPGWVIYPNEDLWSVGFEGREFPEVSRLNIQKWFLQAVFPSLKKDGEKVEY